MDKIFFNNQENANRPLSSILKEAYQALYTLVAANPADSFVFTSSGAEAVNHAIFAAYLDITRKTGKNHFITSNIDEAPAIMAMGRLQELGCLFQMAPADREGCVSVEAIAETITPRTAMLSLSWANGLTGVIQPVAEIAELCRERGILFHVEATHVLGKGEYTLEGSGADLLTFNGEQLQGPKASGGLYIREGVEISPLIMGGDEQATLRGGALDMERLVALAEAAKEALAHSDHLCMEIARLRNRLEELMGEGEILFKEKPRVPNITALVFPGVASDALHYLLNCRGLYASAGGMHFQKMQHILKASEIEEPHCHSGLSFALSRDTTEKQVEKGAEIINEEVLKLQSYSQGLV